MDYSTAAGLQWDFTSGVIIIFGVLKINSDPCFIFFLENNRAGLPEIIKQHLENFRLVDHPSRRLGILNIEILAGH